MTNRITKIKMGESSLVVGHLHAAIELLGLRVDATERNERRAGDSTAALVGAFQRRAGIELSEGWLVDQATAVAMNQALADKGIVLTDGAQGCWVRGKVYGGGAGLARDLMVTAYDRDLRTRQQLGRSSTRNDGQYVIYYGAEQYAAAEQGGPDLVLEVQDRGGAVLFTSPVVFNADPALNYDIELLARGGESLFDRLLRLVQPLLAGQNVTLEQLDDNEQLPDIAFLAGETGVEWGLLVEFVLAHRLAREGLPAEFWFALLRAGAIGHPLPPAAGWPSLVDAAGQAIAFAMAITPQRAEDGVKTAFALQVIGEKAGQRLKAWMCAFRALLAQHAQPSQESGERTTLGLPQSATVRQLLDMAPLEGAQRELAFAEYLEEGERERTMQRLRKGERFKEEALQAIDNLLALHDLSFGDLVLVRALVGQEAIKLVDPHAVQRLARWPAAQWEKFMQRAQLTPPAFASGDDDPARRHNYARLIAMQMQRAYPGAALAADMAHTLSQPGLDAGDGRRSAVRERAPKVLEFLEQHPDFDLARTGIDHFLKQRSTIARSGIAPDPQLVAQLKATQRVVKIAPDYRATESLLEDNIHSAQQVYRMGKQEFVRRYAQRPGFTAELAQDTFERAANTHAAAVAIVGDLHAVSSSSATYALASGAALDFPNMTNLFGRADACECEQCRSVFSASAYLADVLMYLEQRKAADGVSSVRSVLFARRPDLGAIELTCTNTNTTLPYVDLACEVLEDQVAPWVLLPLPLALVPLLAQGPIAPALKAAFAAAAPPLALSAARLHGPDGAGNWIMRDSDSAGEHTWQLRVTGAGVDVSVLRQTRGDAAQLLANPEYVNGPAYDVLAAALFPMTLPFDLASEELNAYLARIGLPRSQLMDALRGPASPNNPSDLDIAASYLGLNATGRAIIFAADPVQQFRYWGEASNAAALVNLAPVDIFLDRVGISYLELQTLLSLGYVNPGGAAGIAHLDTSCDLGRKQVTPLTVDLLDRIHRFLRLWRTVGWSMYQLDMVLRNAGVGKGVLDSACLLQLYAFMQVRMRLTTLSVEQTCALFDRIGTESRFTGTAAAPAPSLYVQLFLDKRVMDPPDPAFAIEAVQAADVAVPPATVPDLVPAHLAPLIAATRVKAADLAIILGLHRPVADPEYAARHACIDGKLHLGNLSFVYRHALLIKALRIKAADWQRLLWLLQRDVFATPQVLIAFLAWHDRMLASRLNIDELAWVLAADPRVKGAETDKAISATLSTLRKTLQGIAAAAATSLPNDTDGLIGFISAQLLTLGWDAASVTALAAQFQPTARAAAVPDTLVFPPAITGAIPVAFDGATKALSFRGLMSAAQRTTLLTDAPLAAVTVLPDYQAAIAALFDAPRAAMRTYFPQYRTGLRRLPEDVQFLHQLAPDLAARISYDVERGQLVLFGGMTVLDRTTLNGLSTDADYLAAVLALFNLAAAVPPAGLAWVLDADDLTSAAAKLAAWVGAAQARQAVIGALSAALKQTPAIMEQLLDYALFGAPRHLLLDDFLASAFTGSSAALAEAGFPEQFRGYRWLHRVALVLGKATVNYADLAWLRANSAATGTIDFAALPLVYVAEPAAPFQFEALLDLARMVQLKLGFNSAPSSLFGVLQRLIADAGYTAALFAADAEALAGWPRADVAAFVARLDAAYPADYRKVAGWNRLARGFDLLRRINGAATHALVLAAPEPTAAMVQMLKQLLSAKYEPEQWLDISKAVQDHLRQRKRDSLTSYLLTQAMPVGAPSHKWGNTNDLYAYYLIDVEMCACMQTSRIVLATHSVQLFVQRCFMGLEPGVRVSVDADDAWKQWKWMANYRLWEANRRVFVYPENYALPELRRDKSEMFRKLEDELLQSELNRDNVETAFLHYLERLDEIAQLEIAGTYYEENNRTLHVFGRTPGSEPHSYFYRRHIDGRRWTAWNKVECDIKSDYLVPLVHNDRLHLVWPEFRERAGDQGSVNIPSQGATNKTLDKPLKKMDVYLAVTEFRSGKWTPKKIAQEPVNTGGAYQDDFDKSPYVIIPLDFTWIPQAPFLLMVCNANANSDANSNGGRQLFELAGCKGYPEPYQGDIPFRPVLTRFERDQMVYIKNAEKRQEKGDALVPHMSFALNQKILDLTPGLFKISHPQYMSRFDRLYFAMLSAIMQDSGWGSQSALRERGYYVTLGTYYDWFYADKLRTFFVQHEVLAPNGTRYFYHEFIPFVEQLLFPLATGQSAKLGEVMVWFARSGFKFQLLFNNFYHPLTCHLTKRLYAGGVDALLERDTQFADKKFDFGTIYKPTAAVVDPEYPVEVIDFTPGKAYSQYNWELFYFAPLTIAMRLSSNQKFEDAMRWFHYIFDPTGGHDRDPLTHALASAPQKFWITKPFYERLAVDYDAQRIEQLMNMLANNAGGGTPSPLVKALQDHIDDWRKNPFDPHIVAQFRTVTYQKLTVMKYIDNLVAWGDHLFRQFTMESVSQATQMYVLAAEILGPRPARVAPPAKPTPETFNEIEDKLDAFSNAMVELENFILAPPASGGGGAPVPPIPALLYFCIPQNDQLIAYWDRVEDRLYKLRHCLDIDGAARSLALFAPPIDPAALISALAGGADLAGAIAGLDAPLPHYRFSAMLQKANEFNNDLKSLGGALLSALEKIDGEALTHLRQQQELSLLNAARAVKEAQIDEATQALAGLQTSREMVAMRRDFYASREMISPGEAGALGLTTASLIVHAAGAVADVLGGVVAAIPDFQIGASGFGGSPHASVKTGGVSFSKAAELAARALYQTSTLMDKSASIASTLAGYQRRLDDWQHQLALTGKELVQMDKQIAGAKIRVDNANRELTNHDLQIDNSKAMDEFYRDKYTRQELYEWMRTQVAQSYFQSYQLAFDLARRAERCYQYELGVTNTSFIEFGYWNSMKSGLLAGERLQLALRQMETAYMQANRREFECTKHISVGLINPLALVQLKDKGSCMVEIAEELFDLDYPGHYFRRIKSVSLSLPCVAGPHTTVNCTLRLVRNMVRVNASSSPQYEHNNDNGVLTDDPRFRESHVRANAIATSNGQNDSGMFELNFKDERYLPFEGAGAVSIWQIELVADLKLRQFDYNTISDVILHLRYSAREDGGQFKENAVARLHTVLANTSPGLRLRRMFDLRREFATEWYAFLHPATGGHKTLRLQLTRQHFAMLGKESEVQVEALSLALQTRSDDEMKVFLSPPLGDQAADQLTLAAPAQPGEFRTASKKEISELLDDTTPWNFRLRKSALGFDDLAEDEVKECFLVVEYTLQG